jgi:hypothetical protein
LDWKPAISKYVLMRYGNSLRLARVIGGYMRGKIVEENKRRASTRNANMAALTIQAAASLTLVTSCDSLSGDFAEAHILSISKHTPQSPLLLSLVRARMDICTLASGLANLSFSSHWE